VTDNPDDEVTCHAGGHAYPGWIRAAFDREPDYPYDAVHPADHAAMTGQPPPERPTPELRIPADPAGLDALLADVTPERTTVVARLMGAMYRQPDDSRETGP
jgi:hypothetical protein